MRLAFLGTPDFAVAALAALVAAGHEIACVYSQPPAPRGRGQALKPSPVHAFAESLGLPVRTPGLHARPGRDRRLRGAGARRRRGGRLRPDPAGARCWRRRGWARFNLHGSLLPRWRGAAPIQRAIMAGDPVTGVAGHADDRGPGRGPGAGRRETVRIDAAGHRRHPARPAWPAVGAELLVADPGRRSRRGDARSRRRRPRRASPTPGRSRPKEARHRLGPARPARSTARSAACRRSPAPGSSCRPTRARCGSRRCCRRCRGRRRARRARCWTTGCWSACGEGAVRLLRVQREGRGPQDAEAFLRGLPVRGRDEARLMPRYRLTLEYDGRPYNGFQAQADLPTVQGALERAVQAFCGEDRAGARRRAHRHRRPRHRPGGPHRPRQGLAGRDGAQRAERPPGAASRSWCWTPSVAPEDWHARFSATERRYLYRILNRPSPPALEQGRVWHVKKPLDAEAMHAAAQALVGLHDFTTFRDVDCQAKSPVKTLDVARVCREGEEVRAGVRRALVPAPPGPLDDRVAWPRWAWAAGRPARPRGAPWRPATATRLRARWRRRDGPVPDRRATTASSVRSRSVRRDYAPRRLRSSARSGVRRRPGAADLGDRRAFVDLVHGRRRPGPARPPGRARG